MKTLILISALYFTGCAYQGDVLIYSPGGNVDKATQVESKIGQ